MPHRLLKDRATVTIREVSTACSESTLSNDIVLLHKPLFDTSSPTTISLKPVSSDNARSVNIPLQDAELKSTITSMMAPCLEHSLAGRASRTGTTTEAEDHSGCPICAVERPGFAEVVKAPKQPQPQQAANCQDCTCPICAVERLNY